MIRNRRADTGIEWTKRIVETIPIDFSEERASLYEAVSLLKANPISLVTILFQLLLYKEKHVVAEKLYIIR